MIGKKNVSDRNHLLLVRENVVYGTATKNLPHETKADLNFRKSFPILAFSFCVMLKINKSSKCKRLGNLI